MELHLDKVRYDPILETMSANFTQGQMIGIIGPNGAGKSTLLRVISGIWRCSQGNVFVDGQSIYVMDKRARARQLSFMPQQLADDISFTVNNFIEMGLYPFRNAFGMLDKTVRDRVQHALVSLKLQEFLHKPLAQLSGGERQRVAIARCLAQGSPIIILDEPIANLDVAYQLEILTILSTLAKNGHLVILSIHDLELAARFATSLYVLAKGKLVANGVPREVLRSSMLEDVFHVVGYSYDDPYTKALRLSLI